MKFEETETLELKKSTSEIKEGIISITSILNKHQKGVLYFGIKNDGTVVGQSVSEKTIRDVSMAINNHIEPKIYPLVKRINIEGKDCLLVKFEGDEIPYYAYGRAYIRVGDSDLKLNPKEIENLILKKHKEIEIFGDSLLPNVVVLNIQLLKKEGAKKIIVQKTEYHHIQDHITRHVCRSKEYKPEDFFFIDSTVKQDILNVIKDNNKIVLLGDPGVGKTYELKRVAAHFYEKEPQYYPYLIYLNKYVDQDIEDFLFPNWKDIPEDKLLIILV